MESTLRPVARCVLGGSVVFTGVGHPTTQREEFPAQVPTWFPVDADRVLMPC